jgi:hypothetical protein
LDRARGGFDTERPKGTTILVIDDGRRNVAAEAGRLLAADQRVVVANFFSFWRNCKSNQASITSMFDTALLIGAMGERPFGIQLSWFRAVASWGRSQRAAEPLNVLAVGPRNSLIALVTATLSPDNINSLELHGALQSLKEIIEDDWSVDRAPEMFCFGLLQSFDIKKLEALISPRRIVHK